MYRHILLLRAEVYTGRSNGLRLQGVDLTGARVSFCVFPNLDGFSLPMPLLVGLFAAPATYVRYLTAMQDRRSPVSKELFNEFRGMCRDSGARFVQAIANGDRKTQRDIAVACSHVVSGHAAYIDWGEGWEPPFPRRHHLAVLPSAHQRADFPISELDLQIPGRSVDAPPFAAVSPVPDAALLHMESTVDKSPIIPTDLTWFINDRTARLLETRRDGSSLWRVTLTPKKSERLLRYHNERNRFIREQQVALFREIILLGEWLDRFEIVLDEEGQIVEGQHRLSGVVAAEKNVSSLAIVNLPRGQMLKQVPDIIRKAKDEVALHHVEADGTALRPTTQQQAVYSAIRRVVAKRPALSKVTPIELLEAMKSPWWPLIVFAAGLRAMRFLACMPLRVAALLAVHHGHDEEAVQVAWNNWLQGTDIEAALVHVRDEINRRGGTTWWATMRGESAAREEVQCYAQAVMLRLLGKRHGKVQKLRQPVWSFEGEVLVPAPADESEEC